MWDNIDIWTFLAGLGIFLLGLYDIETGLKHLIGRSFKKWLRRQTRHPVQGIVGGTAITMLLQSSSVVSLMVLAFVGAGILPLKNAIGILFGTNLGTTFTGWIVATLGFEVKIAAFSMPLLALGGLGRVFSPPRSVRAEIGRLLLGFGLLFLGLEWMKEGIELFASEFDLTTYQNISPYWFFLIGLIFTAIIQSSSAAMVITLSSLYAGIIGLEAGAAMVIGSDLGTTITVMLGAIKGSPAKKRVASSHVIFNFVTDIIALALLYPLLWVITDLFLLQNPLFILVCFHSLFNLLGIVLLAPFIPLLAQILENRFTQEKETLSFLAKVPPNIPDAALEALTNETLLLIKRVLQFHTKGLGIRQGLFRSTSASRTDTHEQEYANLKHIEGEMVTYTLQLPQHELDAGEAQRLEELAQAIRLCMLSAKSIKDVVHNVRAFEASSNDVKLALFKYLKGQLYDWYLKLHHLLHEPASSFSQAALSQLEQKSRHISQKLQQELYAQVQQRTLSEAEISTLLNVIGEVQQANLNLVQAVRALIDKEELGALGEWVSSGETSTS